MGTKFLFDEKPYDISFDAKVLDCQKVEGGYKILLDQTLFFPEQGGQTSDFGTLGGAVISDVQISDGEIYHFSDQPLETGTTVRGLINWEHRFNNMQQHTGEHIFTGLAHNKFGAENVGFHLSDNTVTLDLDIELTNAQIEEIELAANQVIAKNQKVFCWYPSKEELTDIDYRSKKEIDGAIRLVKIGNIDICACCAPHVATTSEVGILKVVSFMKYKGGTRVYILCGLRAFLDYRQKQSIITSTYQLLNCTLDEVPSKASQLIEDNKLLKYQFANAQAAQLMSLIETYPSQVEDITLFVDSMDSKVIREGVNSLVQQHTGLCAIFSGNDEVGYSFVIGSTTRDCAAIMAGMRELLGAKGGGSKQMIQGNIVATKSEIERVF